MTCKLDVNWKALGLDSNKAIFSAPEIKDFQPSAIFKPSDSIPIEPGRGWLLIVSE
ncbi:MAG: hypothetical protein QG588_1728 [Candidatus Poribacteria bacterium]|nr:hypothetical protein [Candidatus Poribacteria bacterium]